MEEKEFGHYQIYKKTNPSSILDYVGGKSPRRKSLHRKSSRKIDYLKRKSSFYSNRNLDLLDNNQKIIPLRPVEENFATVEESSYDSKESKRIESEIRYRNLFKEYKKEKSNYIYSKFSNKNINKKAHNSSSKIYHLKIIQTNIGTSKFFTSGKKVNDNLNNFCSSKDEIYSNINYSSDNSFDEGKSILDFNLIHSEPDEEHHRSESNTIKKKNYKDFQEKIKEIKIKFYSLTSVFYLSLYLLCVKITFKLSMPEIPPLGVSLFIISFNNIIISLLFIKLDQIDFQSIINIKFDNIFFLTIFFNYLKILLLIKSIQHLNLLTFFIIINMTPLIISYILIREKNQSFIVSDYIYYITFIIICLSQFLFNNKISMICVFTLMIINTFTFLANINVIKNYHSYLVDFWTAVLGVAISPLIMSINEDSLNISISQYLLFIIISLTYFLNHYFESKLTKNSLEHGFQIYYIFEFYFKRK